MARPDQGDGSGYHHLGYAAAQENALGHDFIESEDGKIVCSRCGIEETEEAPEGPSDPNRDALATRLNELDDVAQGNNSTTTWNAFLAAKDAAWAVLTDEDATSEQLQGALAALNRAYSNLSPEPLTTYTLTVVSGTGGGIYAAGAAVPITANAAPSGKVFDKWTATAGALANANSATTTFTMPAGAATVTATYKDAPKGIFGTNAKWYGEWWHYLLFFLCFGFIWMWF